MLVSTRAAWHDVSMPRAGWDMSFITMTEALDTMSGAALIIPALPCRSLQLLCQQLPQLCLHLQQQLQHRPPKWYR